MLSKSSQVFKSKPKPIDQLALDICLYFLLKVNYKKHLVNEPSWSQFREQIKKFLIKQFGDQFQKFNMLTNPSQKDNFCELFAQQMFRDIHQFSSAEEFNEYVDAARASGGEPAYLVGIPKKSGKLKFRLKRKGIGITQEQFNAIVAGACPELSLSYAAAVSMELTESKNSPAKSN